MTDNPQPPGFINWSDEELDAMAEITQADIADAIADAREFPELDALLNAEETTAGQE